MLPLPEGIDNYLCVHTSREDPLLHELAEDTLQNVPMARMLTGQIEGTLLRILVNALGARRVIEIGTFTGYSALSMAMGMPEDGELITCDIDPENTAMAQRYWDRSPHGSKISLRLGPALDTLKTLDGPFDFAFIDADKENYVPYWDAVVPKMRSGGLIAVDNVLWEGKVLDPPDALSKTIVAFNLHSRHDDRCEQVMLSVRDGITLARVR